MEVIAVLTAFAVGFAMKYGGLCTYAAAVQIVRARRFERLSAFLTAAAWATLVVVPMAWLWPEQWHLATTHAQWGMVVVGGVLLGVGAWLNRGCVFGTFVQLTSGNLSYAPTVAGMVAGATVAYSGMAGSMTYEQTPAPAATAGLPASLWLLLALMMGLAGLFTLSPDAPGRLRLRPVGGVLVALVLGAGGGALFATVNGWDFASVLTHATYHALSLTAAGPTQQAILCALLMVAGGIAAAVRLKAFSLRGPRLASLLAHFSGGALMGAGAVILPGGNDSLLLKGLPALAPHAIAGFGLMLLTMLLLLRWVPNDKGFSIGRQPSRQ